MILTVVFTSLPVPAFAQQKHYQGRKIVRIEVQDNKSVSEATILSKIKTKIGHRYSQTAISQDLKRLYETGFFTDITINVEERGRGVKVIFVVEEKPLVDKIKFTKIF